MRKRVQCIYALQTGFATQIMLTRPTPVFNRISAACMMISAVLMFLIAISAQTRLAQTIPNTPVLTQTSSAADTIGIESNGTYYLSLANTSKYADYSVDFSAHPGQPIAGDWTGQGFDTIGSYDLKSGVFTLCTANTAADCAKPANLIQFDYGSPNNVPVSGHWTLNAAHDGIGTFDTQNGLFFLRDALSTGNPDHTLIYGIAGDQAMVGDWQGQGIDTPGLFRSSSATFMLSDQIANGQITTDHTISFGVTSYPYIALAGRWLASEKHSGVGLYDSATGTFVLNPDLSGTSRLIQFPFGAGHSAPLVGHWQQISSKP